MPCKKIALALFACLALGAFAANAAQADQWTLGTTEDQTTAGTKILSESVRCSRHGTTELILHGELLGIPVTLKANQIDCVSATIDSTLAGKAHSAGTFTFTEVTVTNPSNCKVASGDVTTAALTDELLTDPSGGSIIFDKIFPESGTSLLDLTFAGATCALAEVTATVTGTLCGESVHTNGSSYVPNASGTLLKVQTLLFGAAQQTTGGCALTLGGKPALLTGAVDFELSGTNVGKPFGADV